jgi:hypothetical protein
VVADFREADVGERGDAVAAFLAGIEMFSLVVNPGGCHLRQYDPPPKSGTLPEAHLTHDELIAILLGWRDHVLACSRLKS